MTLACCLACTTQHPTAAVPARTEILWDTFGVPHIYGRTTRGLFHAVGWAQMEAHGDLILRLYAQSRGRAAEFLGDQMLESDRRVHTVGIPDLAQTLWKSQAPQQRELLEGYAAGINDWAAKHRDRVPADLAATLPIVPADVLAHMLRAIHLTFVVGRPDAIKAWLGSNAWAIGPRHSASGHAMLLANPHIPWEDLFTFFEMQLVAPGVDAYTAVLVGLPTIGIGWNRHLAWTHTVNTIDAADYYDLSLQPGGYLLDGKLQPLHSETRTIKVRAAAGLRDETITLARSVHGPIVAKKQPDSRALALRVAGLDRPNMILEYWDMMRATNLREFEKALRRQQMPMFTVIYADRDGHIMHLFNGTVPIRSGGTFEDYDRVLDGTRSGAIWTGIHRYEDLPRVLDPPSGWLQNANDPPWTTTFPLAIDPARYPSYIAPRGMELRAQRSARMIMEDRDKITFDELVAYKYSTHMELADRVLPDLLAAARARGSERAKLAADVLAKWDRTADAHSRGAVLFETFDSLLRKRPKSVWRVPWNPARPLETPTGLADPAAAIGALDEAAELVEKRYGALDVAWGQVHRLRMGSRDLPASGAPEGLGALSILGYKPDPDGKTEAAFMGDSFIAAVELGPQVRARVLIAYGNSSREGSPHRGDQLELYAKRRLRDAWMTRAEIQAHLERREPFDDAHE